VNDLSSLLYLVNQNTITFHTFLSRTKDLEHPDYVLFDLDPGPLAFKELIRIAKQLHKIFIARKVKSFIKTSGKSGLHVLTPPPKKRATYEDAREWAMPIAEELVAALPDIATTERSIAARGKRAYIDVMQNGLGKHVVPPYVIRVTELATVSMPLDWDELTPSLTPQKFTIDKALKRLAKLKKDPFAPLLK
jgi:bifunctional non-homologous end joining protein LigD